MAFRLSTLVKERFQPKGLELEFTRMKNHFDFQQGKYGSPVLDRLKLKQFAKIKPLLLDNATKLGILNELNADPQTFITLNYKALGFDCRWIAPFGQHVPAHHTKTPPAISVFNPVPGLYSLALIDLDRELTTSYEHYCHWLVTNIDISKSGPIPLGQTLLEYEPLMPAKSNPKNNHRLVILLLKQSPSTLVQKPADRHSFLPVMSFVNRNGLQISGMGFFTTVWSPLVSQMYKDLGFFCLIIGIHEPIYGYTKAKPQGNVMPKFDILEFNKAPPSMVSLKIKKQKSLFEYQ
jgi:hypothetical protein